MFYANFDIGTQMSVNQVLKFGFEFLIINGAYLRIYHILWTSAGFDSCLRKLGLYFLRISKNLIFLRISIILDFNFQYLLYFDQEKKSSSILRNDIFQ